MLHHATCCAGMGDSAKSVLVCFCCNIPSIRWTVFNTGNVSVLVQSVPRHCRVHPAWQVVDCTWCGGVQTSYTVQLSKLSAAQLSLSLMPGCQAAPVAQMCACCTLRVCCTLCACCKDVHDWNSMVRLCSGGCLILASNGALHCKQQSIHAVCVSQSSQA